MNTLDVVVGGLYGSEAKGHAVQRLAEKRVSEGAMLAVVRVAGPNAGHTGYDPSGTPWALRQVPVAAVVPGPIALVLAAGSEVDPPVLLDELDRLGGAGLLEGKTIIIHGEATVITDKHKQQEADGMLTSRLGSTGKGIGAARADRLMRTADRVQDLPDLVHELQTRGVYVDNGPVPSMFSVIVEGTQGYALGLHAGFYPQCTSSDCRAIDFLAMAGINPWEFYEENFTIWVVARVFPIRVAGNSGPLKDEVSWSELGLPEEHTTVTKKVRRVGKPDWDLVREAVQANGPSQVKLALSMVDQLYPQVKNKPYRLNDPAWQEARNWLNAVEAEVGAKVGLVMSGPNTAGWRGDLT